VAPLPSGERSRDLSLLLFGVATLALATPLRLIWGDTGRPWYLPFAVWLVINLLLLWVARSSRSHEA
jgi:membrane protein implicated in regulation of membrane protease activity